MNLRRVLCTLSGDDYSIINQCEKSIQNRFMAIGGFVAAIFVLCFISSYFTFTMLFQNYFIGIPIAIFFAWMITNIYLLLLYTLSKNSFPCFIDRSTSAFSILLRISFICFIAIVISKPIEHLFFRQTLKTEIENFKISKIEQYSKATQSYFNEEINSLKLIIHDQEVISNKLDALQIHEYNQLILKKEIKRDELIASMVTLVYKSNYYIQGIKILNTFHKSCWFITIIIIFVFLFPAYLKNFLGKQSVYYEIKSKLENRIVKEEYLSFKKRYSKLFKEEHESDIQFSESFVDAPFNTIRKMEDRMFFKEEDLISDLYNV